MTAASETARLRRRIFGRCRDAAINDETRRLVQQRATGKASLTEMTPAEMRQVLLALGGSDPRPVPVAGAERPSASNIAMLRALWISAYWLGVVRAREDHALDAWLCRQAGVDSAQWATVAQIGGAVDALKSWMSRVGGVDWAPYSQGDPPRRVYRPAARVLEALWRKARVAGLSAARDETALQGWVAGVRHDPAPYTELAAPALNQVVRHLGMLLRECYSSGPEHIREK